MIGTCYLLVRSCHLNLEPAKWTNFSQFKMCFKSFALGIEMVSIRVWIYLMGFLAFSQKFSVDFFFIPLQNNHGEITEFGHNISLFYFQLLVKMLFRLLE